MDALSLLLNRQSQARLQAPAPDGISLDNIMRAALRVPDHAGLTPWRFVVCQGKGLTELGAIFERSAIENDRSQKEIERAIQLPLRAPMVIVAIACYREHEKVPRVEQIASASCAVMAMQMAAQAQGFNGIWRTGAYAHCDVVRRAFELAEEDEIIGFLYLGTPAIPSIDKPALAPSDYFTRWE
ncbi:NAD(P)H nitroreductase [Aestuariibacter sp. A3R04]|uniref:NAD(P)H nitroreductase n=1 Tax=Aestuariibacter sp. A3R04 TaxID=2841571 RepID=UPI001C08A396|nr:NAD(P)H nitroreductase [Aestuariibacter sp. A3R04]MBU3023065.1 NAD(P)H nitroreductase [Aestuariibacter sp. A3R04]